MAGGVEREFIGALVHLVAGVSLDPFERHFVLAVHAQKALPEVGVLFVFVLLLLLFEDDEEEKKEEDCKLETHTKYAEITPLFRNAKKYRYFI